IKNNENAEDAVIRELEEETGVSINYLEQLKTFTNPDRDPRERIISIAYYALVDQKNYELKSGEEAETVNWYPIKSLKKEKLAFDHKDIINSALERLKAKIRYQPIGFELLSAEFTLAELHRMFTSIVGYEVDK